MTDLLTTKDALAKAIRAVTDLWDEPLDEVHDVPQIVNGLIASGVVIDVSTLAEDATLVDRVCEAAGVESPGSGPDWHDTQAVLRTLAAALEKRGAR